MVDIICDADFLIRLAGGRVNLDEAVIDLGTVEFVVPDVVIRELSRLDKGQARLALEYARRLRRVRMEGEYADRSILEFVRKNGGLVATLDRTLRRQLHGSGFDTITLHRDRVILESQH